MVARTARLPRIRTAVAVLLLALTAVPLLRATDANAVAGDQIAITDITDKGEGTGTGTTPFVFDVTLTPGSPALYGGETVTWAVAAGTAKGGTDCTDSSVDFILPDTESPGSTTLIWVPNDPAKTKTITIDVCKDAQAEPNETFTVTLTHADATRISDGTGVATITNDDGTSPTVSTSSTSVTEGNSNTILMTWSVSLSVAATGPVSVDYAFDPGTATTPSDYEASTDGLTGTLNWTSGQHVKTLAVKVKGDTVDENNETVLLTLSDPVNTTIASGSTQTTGTINDDDAEPTLSIDPGPTVAEDATPANFTVKLNPASGREVTVNFTTANGTATSPGDYTGGTQKVTFAPGETSKTVGIPVIEDTAYEGSETFTATISGPFNALIDSTKNTATATITDNEAAPTVSVADTTAAEPINPVAGGAQVDGKITFTVSLKKADGTATTAGSPVTVNYQTSDLTAKADEDYTAKSGTATIATGQSSATFDIVVLGDPLHEDTEKMKVTLTGVSGAIINDGVAEGTITDNDAAPTFTVGSGTVTEGNSSETTTPMNFAVTLSGASARNLEIKYVNAVGTTNPATAGVDYAPVDQTLVIPAGQTAGTITVNVYGDTKDEVDETFKLTLTPGNGARSTGNTTTTTGTINDDDAPPTVSIDSVNVQEGNSGTTAAVFTVSLSTESGRALSVKASTAPATAVSSGTGADFAAKTNELITFAEGEKTKTFSVNVNGDTAPESNETFTATLTEPTNSTLSSTNATGTGTIVDDDGAVPTVNVADTSATEGNIATFNVTLSSPSTSSITVTYATSDSTALAPGDYTSKTNTLTFPANTTGPLTVTVQTTEDTAAEPDEAFILTLTNPTPSDKAVIGRGVATGTIVDDDGTPVASVSGGSSAAENIGSVLYTISLSSSSASQVTVKYATADGTAKAGEDYTTTSGVLTIPANTTSGTVSVPVTNDSLDEDDETFTFKITDATNATISGSNNTVTTTITDNDASPALSIDDVSIVEGNTGTRTATFTITMAAKSARTASVTWATADGGEDDPDLVPNATAGEDYTSGGGVVTFAPGDLTKTVTVDVIGDATREDDEEFSVVLSAPVAATIADDRGVGTIVNDDGFTLKVDSPSAAEDNGDGTLTFTVTKEGVDNLLETVTVDYAFRTGTASNPGDWGPMEGGTLTFGPTDMTQEIVVPITDDDLDEADEDFFVDLSNAVQATITTGTGKGTITDNEDPPTLTVTNPTVAEGNPSDPNPLFMTFVFTLSEASGRTVSVAYATADDTAKQPGDYVSKSGTVTFAAGETQQSVAVSVARDLVDEVDETLFLNLSSPANVTLPDPAKATGTITDDDALPTLSINDVAVKEPKSGATANAVFTVALSAVSGKTVSVNWSTSDGTAKSTDYSVSNGTATITPGKTSTTISVPIKPDSTAESAETFSVQLSLPTNATITDGNGTATISDSGLAGYMLTAEDGGIFNYGDAPFYGSVGGMRQNAPVVGMTWTPDRLHYWQVGADGGIFSYGNPGGIFYGSAVGQATAPVVGMAATGTGKGYWIASTDGNVYNFGDAPKLGNMFGKPLNKPIVAILANKAGNGYWLIASDGGVFNYNAPLYGSLGDIRLVSPIVGAAVTTTGGGYYMVARDGGVFAFGDGNAPGHFLGSMAGRGMDNFVGMNVADAGWGYRLVSADGEVYPFGTGTHLGSPKKSGLTLFLPLTGTVGY